MSRCSKQPELMRFQLTGMRSEYFCRIRSASALRFSKGCSSLNLERILVDGSLIFEYGFLDLLLMLFVVR